MRKLYLLLALIAVFFNSACNKDESEYEVWTVASEMGVARNWATFQTAYLVKKGDQKPWQPFLHSIQGFEFERGYESRIRVRIDPVGSLIQDGPSNNYTMTDLLAREHKQSIDPADFSPQCELTFASEPGIYLGTPCLWVKEPSTGVTRWAPFTATVEGFEYAPGYEYRLRVRLAADTGNKQHPIKTIFCELLSQEEKQSEEIPANTPG